jgi:hypothetical protein
MSGECSTFDGEGKCLQNSCGETREQEPLARSSCKWEYNIKMDPKYVGCIGVD